MNRWLTFFGERFPLVNSLALVTGISLSGIYLSGRPFHFFQFILSFVGMIFILALMRLMEDVKNLEKDRIAHLDRPLPRGLIKKSEAIFVIDSMQIVLLAYCMLLWILLNIYSGLCYLIVVIFFWLMYKDFGMKKQLVKHSLINGFLTQLINVPIVVFAVSVTDPAHLLSIGTCSFAAMLFGAFFCYDLCHKLNPHIHPVYGTYIHFYGFRIVYNIAAVALIISAMGAINLGLAYFLIPVEVMVLAALSAVFFQPSLFRIPEMISHFSLMLHVWAVVIFKVLWLIFDF